MPAPAGLQQFKPHLQVVKNAFANKPLASTKAADGPTAAQGDGVDAGHTSFKQVVKNVLEHPATSALAGAALVGLPVFALTGNPLAAAIAGGAGAVAGGAVNVGVRLVAAMIGAFEEIG